MSQPTVFVARVDRAWRAEIPHLRAAHWATRLPQLHRWVRDQLGAEPVNYRFDTGDSDLDGLIEEAREARWAARRTDRRVRELTGQALAACAVAELSGRDLAILLALSHQRIHQLQREAGKPSCVALSVGEQRVEDVVDAGPGRAG